VIRKMTIELAIMIFPVRPNNFLYGNSRTNSSSLGVPFFLGLTAISIVFASRGEGFVISTLDTLF